MLGVIRIIAGLLTYPFCVAASLTVLDVLGLVRPESYSAVTPETWALVIGFVLWSFLYLTMPRPVRTYVLAHELTHALWGTLMGARITKFKVSRDGGSVTLSKNNFLITLAPYFFPFYTFIVILIYAALSLFLELGAYELYWLGLVGLTWGFHFSFTISMLLQHQSDIQRYGHLFSYGIIILLNVLGIAIWIVAVSSVTGTDMWRRFAVRSVEVWSWLAAQAMAGGRFLAQYF